jgi:hypothetical protein
MLGYGSVHMGTGAGVENVTRSPIHSCYEAPLPRRHLIAPKRAVLGAPLDLGPLSSKHLFRNRVGRLLQDLVCGVFTNCPD